MPAPGRLILPDDIRPLGQLERRTADDGLRHTQPLKFAPVDYANDFVFFNHGVLFTHGGFTDDTDPVGDWFSELSTRTDVFKQAFRTPMFEGLDALTFDDRVSWNRVLCGVPKDHWPSLLEHLAGICVLNRKANTVKLVYYGQVEIYDPSYVDQHGVLQPGLPTIQCVVFCLSGNKTRHEFVRSSRLVQPPRLETLPPTPAMVNMGRELLFDSKLDPLIHRHNPAHADFLKAYQEALQRGPQIIT